MFRFLPTLLFVAFLLPSCKSIGYLYHQTSPVSERASGSVVRLSTVERDGHCTGFVIAPKQVLTAAHCLAPNTLVDGKGGKVLKVDEYYDLALLEVDTDKDPLPMRDLPVTKFEMIIGIGYGYGWNYLTVLDEKVVIVNYEVEKGAPVGIITQGGYIGGMSGGPVIDQEGQVVGIVQRSAEHVGYGVGVQLIRAFLLGSEVNGPSGHTQNNRVEIGKLHIVPHIEDH